MPSRALGDTTISWTACLGRNGWDTPSSLPPSMAAEARNVVFGQQALCKRVQGSTPQGFTGANPAQSMGNFISHGAGGLGFDLNYLFWTYLTGGGSLGVQGVINLAGHAVSTPTLIDAITSRAQDAAYAQLNGKLYIAYTSAVNRLHVFDPNLDTTKVRRVGLATPGAPTAANTGSGSYAATLRYYRVCWRVINGATSALQRQSLLGPSVSFTPSGSGASATVTQPTPPGEGESHWAVFASTDNAVYYELIQVAIATTTYADTVITANYPTFPLAPNEGANTPFPSCQFLLSTGVRLVGFGMNGPSAGDSLPPTTGRVIFSPPIGTTQIPTPLDDDERVSNTVAAPGIQGWIDVGLSVGASDAGLVGPIGGQIVVLQSKGVYVLSETGIATQPYSAAQITPIVGAIPYTACMAEDEMGQPAAYWADPARGPYRYGVSGLQWLGYDIQDLWKTVNGAATTRVAFSVYHAVDKSWWLYLATGASNTPNLICRFDTRLGTVDTRAGGLLLAPGSVRYGWSVMDGADAAMIAAVSSTPILGNYAPKPYAASVSTGAISRMDDDGVVSASASYITSAAMKVGPLIVNKELGRAFISAAAAAGTTIQQTLVRDYGVETRQTSVSIAPVSTETRVVKGYSAADLIGAATVQVTLGDVTNTPAPTTWQIDEWAATFQHDEERSA